MAKTAAPKPPISDSARQTVVDFLAKFGLENLADWAWGEYKKLGGGQTAFDSISVEMVDQPAFKSRFPAYQKLAAEGHAMSPAEMLAYENQAIGILRGAGLPPSFYDTPGELGDFMANHVSVQELQARVQQAQTVLFDSPPEVRSELDRLYGLKGGEMTAYLLDPTKALPVIQNRVNAAQIAAQADTTGYGQISQAQAERLTAAGIDATKAQAGFGQLAAQKGLFEQQVAGEDQIGSDVQIAAAFSNQEAAMRRIKQRQEQRTADFQGRSGFGLGNTGVTGLGGSDQSGR